MQEVFNHPNFEWGGVMTDRSDLTDAEIGQLLELARMYVAAFSDDEMLTLPERMRLQEIEDIVNRCRGGVND